MSFKRIKLEYGNKRRVIVAFAIVLLFAIYFFKEASFLLKSASLMGLLVFFYVVDHLYNIRFKHRHYAYIILIGILSFMLSHLYFIFPNYDKVQHFIQPMLICSIIFFMISKLHLELKWKIVFTFFIVVAILGLFEIGEFALDSFFDLKLQGVYLRDAQGIEKFHLLMNPLKDTMVDLIFGVLGAGIYCVTFALIMRKKLHHNIFKDY